MSENRLNRYELELMDVMCTIGEGTVQDVCDNLTREPACTTVMTKLNLLATRKNVLSRTNDGRAYVYKPLFSCDEVPKPILSDLQSVLFGNRMPSKVLYLMAEDEADQKTADVLRDALRNRPEITSVAEVVRLQSDLSRVQLRREQISRLFLKKREDSR
ncbi:MAG: BlaI/MecI/CopY family transcriptional regulator [Planctomycetaceae bacterium]